MVESVVFMLVDCSSLLAASFADPLITVAINAKILEELWPASCCYGPQWSVSGSKFGCVFLADLFLRLLSFLDSSSWFAIRIWQERDPSFSRTLSGYFISVAAAVLSSLGFLSVSVQVVVIFCVMASLLLKSVIMDTVGALLRLAYWDDRGYCHCVSGAEGSDQFGGSAHQRSHRHEDPRGPFISAAVVGFYLVRHIWLRTLATWS